jgi:hypothetical protein
MSDPVLDAMMRLKALGWSCGDAGVHNFGGVPVVIVVATRDGITLDAQAETLAEAWLDVVRQAEAESPRNGCPA